MIFIIPWVIALIGSVTFAEIKSGAQVKSELDQLLSKFLEPTDYLVQVGVNSDFIYEKILSEGESISEAFEPQSEAPPPLPGFVPNFSTQENRKPAQTRQTFRMIEKPILKAVAVTLLLNSSLPKTLRDTAQKMTQDFLDQNFATKGNLKVIEAAMLSPLEDSQWWKPPWASVIVLGILLLALATYFFRNRGQKGKDLRESILESKVPLERFVPEYRVENPNLLSSRERGPSALPAGDGKSPTSFLPLPASSNFVVQRTDLLEAFLKDADIFRLYYLRLPPAAQLELYAALRGPAFDSLLESFEIAIPTEGDSSVPPTEEQMMFYQKNFIEFIRTSEWQHQQFFGFLHKLTNEQLKTLVLGQNSFVGALMVKFMRPAQAASVLGGLSDEKRRELISQFARIKDLTAPELKAIEGNVRKTLDQLPSYILTSHEEDLAYWTKILTYSPKQEDILMNIESLRPELYPKLAKFRFKLEDLPTLPSGLIQKVLDDIDNELLTKGLLNVTDDTVEFALSHIGPNRKSLIKSHMQTLDGISINEKSQYERELTLKFREVMV